MVYVYATIFVLLNLVFWLSILFGVPGTWLMILFPALLEWWKPGEYMFGGPVLVAAVLLAVVGEILEFSLGAAGAKKAGGSRRAALLAIGGAFVGGILGTAIPVPIVGTLIGACAGAFAGSLAGDLWAGRTLFQGVTAGKGAAVGRLWGTMAKMAVGAVIFVLLAGAAFF